MPRRSRRRRGVAGPLWAPTPVAVSVDKVHPVGDWVVIREEYSQDQSVEVGGVALALPTIGTANTVYGQLVAAHYQTTQRMGIEVGDRVIYREWKGGRWDFNGETVLVMQAEHVLARVV